MTSKVDNTAYVEQDYSFLPIFVFEICLNNVVSVARQFYDIFFIHIFLLLRNNSASVTSLL